VAGAILSESLAILMGICGVYGKVSKSLMMLFLLAVMLSCASQTVEGATIESLSRIGGNRSNRVIGYGLVVGLPGTGDQTTEIPYTTQTITNMLRHMGINVPAGQFMQPNNVAAVMVTGNIPPEAQPGQKFNVSVSAMGNASSLRGGILLMTQLHGANGQVFAQAQGSLLVSGSSAQGATASLTINNPDVGRVEHGGVVLGSVANKNPQCLITK
jgi:flagellar P-ring protein precursor FlgI